MLNGLILGLSGGIDSAVLAYICKRKFGEKTTALIMPDTAITPKTETEDALKMISITGIQYKMLDIKSIVNEYSMYLEPNERAKEIFVQELEQIFCTIMQTQKIIWFWVQVTRVNI